MNLHIVYIDTDLAKKIDNKNNNNKNYKTDLLHKYVCQTCCITRVCFIFKKIIYICPTLLLLLGINIYLLLKKKLMKERKKERKSYEFIYNTQQLTCILFEHMGL